MSKSSLFEVVESAGQIGSHPRRRRGDSPRRPSRTASFDGAEALEAGLVSGEVDGLGDVLRREQTYRWYLAAADAAAALISIVAAAAITGTHLTWLVAAAPAFVVLAAKLQGLYDRDDLVIRKSTWSELPRLLALTGVATVVAYAARAQLLGGMGSRAGFFVALWSFAFVAMLAGRSLARRIARSRAPDERCVIVGNETHCEGLGAGLAGIDGVALVGTVPLSRLAGSIDDLHA